jgi:hypothetical protein
MISRGRKGNYLWKMDKCPFVVKFCSVSSMEIEYGIFHVSFCGHFGFSSDFALGSTYISKDIFISLPVATSNQELKKQKMKSEIYSSKLNLVAMK